MRTRLGIGDETAWPLLGRSSAVFQFGSGVLGGALKVLAGQPLEKRLSAVVGGSVGGGGFSFDAGGDLGGAIRGGHGRQVE